MKPVIIIPVRMASTRLPGKPLAKINGKSMIQRIMESCSKVNAEDVYCAAGDHSIHEHVLDFGGKSVLTSAELPSGSDRIAAALKEIDPLGERYDAVVNFQGDAVNTNPEIITMLLELLEKSSADISTPAMEISKEKAGDPNICKVAAGLTEGRDSARALYFSRAPIPFDRDSRNGKLYQHIGIYVYTRQALEKFVTLPVGILEGREKLEQLRALEAGMHIEVKLISSLRLDERAPADVDTEEDLEAVRRVFI